MTWYVGIANIYMGRSTLARVTQTFGVALLKPIPKARVTQVFGATLVQPIPQARVTQVFSHVLVKP